MKTKRLFIWIILTVCFIWIINPIGYRLWMLKKKSLTFTELPKQVQEYIKMEPYPNDDGLFCINPADTMIYITETIWSSVVSSWVSYVKLIDTRKNITYIINQGTPLPYIYEKKLYIPDRFGTNYKGKDMYEAIYTEYELK